MTFYSYLKELQTTDLIDYKKQNILELPCYTSFFITIKFY